MGGAAVGPFIGCVDLTGARDLKEQPDRTATIGNSLKDVEARAGEKCKAQQQCDSLLLYFAFNVQAAVSGMEYLPLMKKRQKA